MSDILISIPDPKTEADLEALWLGMPEPTRNKIEKLPQGIRDSFLELAQYYALSAYKLGGIRQRQDCHRGPNDGDRCDPTGWQLGRIS